MESGKQTQPWDAQHLAALLQTQLQPQGVAVTGCQTSTGLQLRFQGVTVEQQLLLTPYLEAVLQQLHVPLDTVQIQGCTRQGKLIWQANLHSERQEPASAALATTTATHQAESAIAAQTNYRRLLAMMALAAIAGVAVALWQTRQWPTPLSPEPSRLSTDQPQ